MSRYPVSKKTKCIIAVVIIIYIYDYLIFNANIPEGIMRYLMYCNWLLAGILFIYSLLIFKKLFLKMKGNALYKKGNYDEALEIYDKVVKAHPRTPNALFSRGCIYLKLDRYEEALADLNNFMYHYPKFVKAYVRKGQVLLKQGKFSESIDNFSKAIELNPLDVDAYCGRGVAYYRMNDLEKSFSDFNTTVKIKPELAIGHFNLAAYYASTNNREQSISSLQTAFNRGFSNVDEIFKIEAFNEMKGDSAFEKLVERMESKKEDK